MKKRPTVVKVNVFLDGVLIEPSELSTLQINSVSIDRIVNGIVDKRYKNTTQETVKTAS